MNQKKTIQKTFSFSRDSGAIIEKLKRNTNAKSWWEVIQNALHVYNWLINNMLDGGKIYHETQDGVVSQVVFPNLVYERKSFYVYLRQKDLNPKVFEITKTLLTLNHADEYND